METTECRNCGSAIECNRREGWARSIVDKKPAKWNHYGGYVCCESCDKQATLQMESSFPGAGPAKHLSRGAQETIKRSWNS